MLFNIIITLGIFGILVFLCVWDIKYRLVPPAGWAAVAFFGLISILSDRNILFHAKGFIIIFTITFLLAFLTKGLGGGDIKLLSALGFAFGTKTGIEILISSFLLSGIFMAAVMFLKGVGRLIPKFSMISISSEIPFVPFIAISYILIFTENLLY